MIFFTMISSSSLRGTACLSRFGMGGRVLVVQAFSFSTKTTTPLPATTRLHSGTRSNQYHHHPRSPRHWQQQIVRCFAATDSTAAADTTPPPKKHRVVFLGTPEVAAETLTTLHNASQQQHPPSSSSSLSSSEAVLPSFEIVAVVTQPPRRGKRRKLESSPVQRAAEALHIPVHTPEKANDKTFLDAVAALQPDLCITAAYGQYLPRRFLQCPTYGTVNIHPSLLPKWRGASPLQRALQYGDDRPLGVSVLYTIQQMDAGPIIAQQEYYCHDNNSDDNNNTDDDDPSSSFSENATTLLPKLFAIGTTLLLDRLPRIWNGDITMNNQGVTVQDETKATTAPLITADEAELRPWRDDATTIVNKIRAFSSWPQPYCYLQVGTRDVVKVKLLEARVVTGLVVEPTNVVAANHGTGGGSGNNDAKPPSSSGGGGGLRLVCHDGSVLDVWKLCPATRNPCPARDFQNGYPNETIRWVRPTTMMTTTTKIQPDVDKKTSEATAN
jgi:methionyl-tRNA formyltransferase